MPSPQVSEYVRGSGFLNADSLNALLTSLSLAPGGTALATLGLISGNIYYVDSNVTGGASGAGTSWATAKLTIEEAIQLCTASNGDVILVAPFHNEGAGDAQIFDLDIAGVTIVGLGEGTQRPILDFDHVNSTCDIGANNCTIYGLRFRPSVTQVLIGVDVETGILGTNIVDCEWMNGEDGSGTDEFIKALHLTSGNHDTVMRNLRIRCHASSTHATHGIHVDAASDRCVYNNIVIDGPYATNGILEDAASADTVVEGVTIDVTGTNYGFVSTSTYAAWRDNRGGADQRPVNKLGQESSETLGFGVSKVSNLADGSGTDNLFTITGRVKITSLTGEVTTVLATSNTMKLQINSIDICAATTITDDAVGTMYAIPGLSAQILNGTGDTPVIGVIRNWTTPSSGAGLIAGGAQAAYTLTHVLDGAGTGAVTWRLTYVPLIPGSTVVAAA